MVKKIPHFKTRYEKKNDRRLSRKKGKTERRIVLIGNVIFVPPVKISAERQQPYSGQKYEKTDVYDRRASLVQTRLEHKQTEDGEEERGMSQKPGREELHLKSQEYQSQSFGAPAYGYPRLMELDRDGYYGQNTADRQKELLKKF